jgi:DeoR family transcriptional regulator, aga operon transcriptional repressor
MLPALRRARIIELLRHHGAAGLKDMSDELGVSVSTLRRDVDYLYGQGHLERTHGGAVLKAGLRAGIELEREIASELDSGAKAAIGQRAAGLIQPGQTIIVDSGTTTAAAARFARDRGIPFTAMTNDVSIAAILSESSLIKVHVTGGTIRTGTSTLLGADALQSIGRLRVDLAFIGAHAVSDQEMSDTSIELAQLKRAVIAAADRPVLLADASKLFSRAYCSFGQIGELDVLITDSRVAPAQVEQLSAHGVQVDVVPANGG